MQSVPTAVTSAFYLSNPFPFLSPRSIPCIISHRLLPGLLDSCLNSPSHDPSPLSLVTVQNGVSVTPALKTHIWLLITLIIWIKSKFITSFALLDHTYLSIFTPKCFIPWHLIYSHAECLSVSSIPSASNHAVLARMFTNLTQIIPTCLCFWDHFTSIVSGGNTI